MKKYFEILPGFDTLRYVFTYGSLGLLAKRSAHREQKFFVSIASSIDRHVLSEGLFEKGVIDLLKEFCAERGFTEMMIDIGANVGNHTVALARNFKRVESVEPHPVLFRILEANILYNNLGNVRCHNIGLANEDSSGTLAESVTEHGLSRVRERSQLAPEVFGLSSAAFGKEYVVDLKSAYDFVKQFGAQLDGAFIKIDVEGMEQEIVTAILPLLSQHRILLGFEWFTRSQPGLADLTVDFPGYELWGIRVHDYGRNKLWRAIKMLFRGRYYTLERIDAANLDEVYPLAMLVPKH